MPAEGLGRIWRWPLHSPRRFFSCLLGVVILIAISNMVFGGRTGLPASDRNAAAASASTTPTDTGLPAAPTSPSPTMPEITPSVSPRPPVPGATQQVASTAVAFTRAWADHNRPATEWWARVSRYADPELAAQLKTTDPANVPASKVTGPPHPVAVYYASASVEVPTDAGTVVVALVSDGHRWLVTDIQPKR
jgi:hypothetical protein